MGVAKSTFKKLNRIKILDIKCTGMLDSLWKLSLENWEKAEEVKAILL